MFCGKFFIESSAEAFWMSVDFSFFNIALSKLFC